MEILFLIGWIIGLLICTGSTIQAWVYRDLELWETLPYVWIAAILTGWITGWALLGLRLWVVFAQSRFKDPQ